MPNNCPKEGEVSVLDTLPSSTCSDRWGRRPHVYMPSSSPERLDLPPLGCFSENMLICSNPSEIESKYRKISYISACYVLCSVVTFSSGIRSSVTVLGVVCAFHTKLSPAGTLRITLISVTVFKFLMLALFP